MKASAMPLAVYYRRLIVVNNYSIFASISRSDPADRI
jgi:hypothetical protein